MNIIKATISAISKIGWIPGRNVSREGEALHPSKAKTAELRDSIVGGWDHNQAVSVYAATPEDVEEVLAYRKAELKRIERLAESPQKDWADMDQYLYGTQKGEAPIADAKGSSQEGSFEVLPAEVLRELKAMWLTAAGNPIKPTHIANDANRRNSVFPAANAARIALGMGQLTEVSVIVKAFEDELDRAYDNVHENERRNVGVVEPSFAAKLRSCKILRGLGCNENRLRKEYSPTIAQKIWRLLKLHDKFPAINVVDTVISENSWGPITYQKLDDLLKNRSSEVQVDKYIRNPAEGKPPRALSVKVQKDLLENTTCDDVALLIQLAHVGDHDRFKHALEQIEAGSRLFETEFTEELKRYFNREHKYKYDVAPLPESESAEG